MKYNDKLVISENESHSMLLGQIRKNSKILEFGCANGMMTQYMKEELGCQVYIVEYEKAAYDDAIQYAVDGTCSDIMELEWYDKFQIQFDYVLFADVLEHLIDPERILQKAKDKLKDEGKVLISIPNIAHNDIILKLLNNNFDYTSIGLLDDTHIHFFASNNIEKFAHLAGYKIIDLKYVTRPTFQTEQFYGKKVPLDSYITNMLSEREYGDVYQFIITLQKADKVEEAKIPDSFNRKAASIWGKLYIDRGDGYGEDDVIPVEAEYISSRKYRLVCQIADLENVKEIRYDPIEGQRCIVTKCYVKQGDKELKIEYSSYLAGNTGIILLGTDPMVVVHIDDNENEVFWEMEFIIEGKAFIEETLHNFQDKQNDYLKSNYEADVYRIEKEQELENIKKEKELLLSDFRVVSDMKDRQISNINKELLKQKEISDTIKKELLEEKELLLSDFRAVSDMKDRQISIINKELLKQKKISDTIKKELLEEKEKGCALEARINKIESTMSWKITKGLRILGSKLRIK